LARRQASGLIRRAPAAPPPAAGAPQVGAQAQMLRRDGPLRAGSVVTLTEHKLSGGRSNCKFRSEEGAEYWIYTDLEGERFQWLGGDEEPAATAFAVGAKVQGMYPTGRYYSATVAEVHDGGAAYTLNWDDGDTQHRRVVAEHVRPHGSVAERRHRARRAARPSPSPSAAAAGGGGSRVKMLETALRMKRDEALQARRAGDIPSAKRHLLELKQLERELSAARLEPAAAQASPARRRARARCAGRARALAAGAGGASIRHDQGLLRREGRGRGAAGAGRQARRPAAHPCR